MRRVIQVVGGLVGMISIPFTCLIYALCMGLQELWEEDVPYCCHGRRIVAVERLSDALNYYNIHNHQS